MGGMNAIMKAAASGHTQAVQALVELGGNVNAVSKVSQFLLLLSCCTPAQCSCSILHLLNLLNPFLLPSAQLFQSPSLLLLATVQLPVTGMLTGGYVGSDDGGHGRAQADGQDGQDAIQWAERTGNWETARMIKEAAREKKLLLQASECIASCRHSLTSPQAYEEMEPSNDFHMASQPDELEEPDDSRRAASGEAKKMEDAGDASTGHDVEDDSDDSGERFLVDLQVEESAPDTVLEPTIQV
eukprot:748277-Hanusia_phi.AAC.3